jgi:hypothetical protein
MPWDSWIQYARKRQTSNPQDTSPRRSRRGKSPVIRPLLELLEDRVAPATHVVDTTLDENDGNYGPGNLSLREAIRLANGTDDPEHITNKDGLITWVRLDSMEQPTGPAQTIT